MKEQNRKSEKVLNGKCLYTPGGAAREYAAVGCNFYRGCPYQCRYCYNRTGMTAKVMGVDHAVLKDEFTSLSKRPKKYSELSGEEYAYMCFLQEVEKWKDYLQKTGIFFSFSTDPLCNECFDLTWQCVRFVTKEYGIPVKILTKNGRFSAQQMMKISLVPEERRKLIAFGFTLTGRDDWEPNAPKNIERIRLMRVLHEKGFKTFASIEPIVDFDSSYEMIEKTEKFCDQYLIGLMSSRKANGLEPYDPYRLRGFVFNVEILLITQRKLFFENAESFVYWKESIRNFFGGDNWKNHFNNAPYSVSRDWSLFTGKDIEI